ncbi:MAG: bifunctional 2-keto-4-hydroxyglutarate aldolase/2-keto-3-deoxy-6-phosphogluconate aldolase [Clostridiaceae bacterium]|nr:bifunctional 2-keto-4-hydroxyglutarate aldolase/2-keto-3-deoxy-6-phosphogluconate aldolase [Clostridiaceae bacterium]
MDKEKVILRITEVGVVAVVRAETPDQAKRIADACLEGGIPAIEMTFTVPFAHHVIEELAKTYPNGEMILGAGTVLDPETARIAILSGAQYIVSPYFNPETVKLCNRYRVPVMPGAMTLKEVVEAMEAGADIIKIFPGEAFGPKIIKAIKGPIPYAKMMPTGGVDVNNVAEWIKAGAVAVGVGGALTAGAKTGDYESITKIGKELIEKVKIAREALKNK